MTPLHRSLAEFGEKETYNRDESYQNKMRRICGRLCTGLKEAGNLWGVPVIDFNSVTGMNPMIEEQLIYFYDSGYDRLHPNTNGQERMAHTLMYQFTFFACIILTVGHFIFCLFGRVCLLGRTFDVSI